MQPVLGKSAPTTIYGQQKQQKEGVGKDKLDQQDFLNLLITQLKNQDPMSPMESNDFTSQTTMFSQLDQMINMNTSMQSLVEVLTKQSQSNSSLVNGAGFIGKQIEFSTNTVTLGGDAQPNLNFYLNGSPVASNSFINIYNKAGELVATVKPENMKNGENIIRWDGKGLGGVEVPDGTYQFEVKAYDASGKMIEVQEFGTAIVKGVKMVEGVLYFDTGDGIVSSEYVYSVTNPKEEPKPDPDPKPEGDKKATTYRGSL